MITFVDSSMDPRIFDQRLGGQQIVGKGKGEGKGRDDGDSGLI